MPRTPTRLAGPLAVPLVGAIATVITVPALQKFIVRHIHIENPTGAAVTFTLTIGLDVAAARIYDAISIAGGAAVDFFCYHVLEVTEVMKTYASASPALVLVINGDVCTLG
jgi:hypothetical protein